MKHHTTSTTLTKTHKKDTKSSPLVKVTKTIRAKPTDVFHAWANPALVKQWWGPEGFECPTAKINFEMGGTYLMCMTNEELGMEIWSTGEYLEIVPDRLIVMADSPATRAGKIRTQRRKNHDGPFADKGPAQITVEFEYEGNDVTKMTLSHEGLPARMHDDCVQGWSSALNKLKQLLERH